MLKNWTIILVLLASLHCFPVFAEEKVKPSAGKEICNDGRTLDNNCMQDAYEESDRVMNRIYSNLVADLASPEGVKTSQQIWLNYRDAECSNDIFQLSKPNTLSPFVEAKCKRTLTLERTKRLRQQFEDKCNGCPGRKSR